MSGEITVTRGHAWSEGERVDYGKLNSTGAPTARVDEDAITSTELAASAAAAMANQLMASNVFRNPDLAWNRWRYPDGLLCPVGEDTENALGWFVRPAGAVDGEEDGNGLLCSRSTSVPESEDGGGVSASLKLQGYPGITTVQVGQKIPAHLLAAYVTPNAGATFSCWLYNNTGAAFTPVWYYNGPSSTIDDFAVMGSQGGGAPVAQACANQEWTQISVDMNFFGARGVEWVFQIPSGNLDATGKTVLMTQWQAIPGAGGSLWVPPMPEVFRNVYGATRAPDGYDDVASGFSVGSQWFTNTEAYQCLDATEGLAVWQQLTLEVRHALTWAHRQSTTVAGGAATSGSWETEPLNTLIEDTGNLTNTALPNPASLDSLGAFTLPAGLWQFDIEVPRYAVDGFQSRLYDVDGGAVATYAGSSGEEIYGTAGYASNGSNGHAVSVMRGRLRLTAPTKLRIETKVATTKATDGKGYPSSAGGYEVYAQAHLTLIST